MAGVGRMCSFGESISMTPLQLGALVSAVANGGTLYYLQHPTTSDELAAFEPKGEAAAGYQGRHSGAPAGDAGRGELFEWDSAVAADELSAVPGVWQDGDVFEPGNTGLDGFVSYGDARRQGGSLR